MSSSDIRRSPGIRYLDPVEPALPAPLGRPLSGLGITSMSGSCDAGGFTNDQVAAAKGGKAAKEGANCRKATKYQEGRQISVRMTHLRRKSWVRLPK